MYTEKPGNTGALKCSVESSLDVRGIRERLQHTLGKAFSTFQIDDLSRLIVKGVGEQQNFK